jgi:hypothetical protein
VRFIADSIARLQGEDAVTFRQATAGHLFSVAIERGNDAETARHEVRQFFDAVQASLRTSISYAAE